jgi:tetratricopeptide (TPR) repeat protein
VEPIRFIFWEAVKVLGLVLLGVVCSQGVAALIVRKGWIKPVLYSLILALAGLGAWYVGNDVAAEVYFWTSDSNLDHNDLVKAYSNGLRAVSLRPNNMHYWRALRDSKIRLHLFQSALDDEPALQALSGGRLDEVDEYQFALCSYFLGQNDKVLATTHHLIGQNPYYAAPYVLQGLAYTAEKKYPEAQKSFLDVLQLFPSNETAVEGLARAYYLGGDRQRALAALAETAKFPFPPPVRERFEALKGLYDQ